MGRISALFATRLEPALRLALLQQPLEEPLTGLMGYEAGAELTEDRGIKPGITQLQSQGVLPIDATAHRLGGLSVRESLQKLEDRDQRQPPGSLGGLSDRREHIRKGLIGVDRPQFIADRQVEIAFGKGGTRYSDGFFGHWGNRHRL